MTVETLIADARTYTSSIVSSAADTLEDASGLIQNVGYTGLSFTGVTLPAPPVIPTALVAPTLPNVALDLPEEPDDELLFQDISPIEATPVPLLTAVAPTITLPNQPNQLAEFFPAPPTIDTNLVFPEVPALLAAPMFEAPTLAERIEPTAPSVQLPAFTALAPTDAPIAPTDLQGSLDGAYNGFAPSAIAMMEGYVDAELSKINPRFHTAMAAIETQLATYMAGGTGLAPAVETAIYERSRSKQDAEARRVGDTYASAADRGFTLPPLAILAAAQAARQAGADNNAQAAREIVVMQAEMEQKNLQFAVTTSAALRATVISAMLSYHGNLVQINGQALEYAKSVVGAITELYNIEVKTFGLRLDAYRAEAAVHETRLKSALAAIDLYLAEIKALEAMTNVDRTRVDIYKARVDALQSYAAVYRAQIEAVQGRAGLEKLKLDLFGAQVNGRVAEVQGKNAEWLGYKASIEGQAAIANMHSEEVRAYGIKVDAWGKEISAKTEIARVTLLNNQSLSENLRARLGAYSAVVNARGDTARTRLENGRQQILSFQAQVEARLGDQKLRSDYYKYTGEIAIKNAELSINAIVQSGKLQREYGNSLAQLGTALAQVYSNQAAASLSGMNTLASNTLTQ